MTELQLSEATFSVSVPGPSFELDEPLPIGMKRMTTGLLSAAIANLRKAETQVPTSIGTFTQPARS